MAVTDASLRARVRRIVYRSQPMGGVYEDVAPVLTDSATSMAVTTGTGTNWSPGDYVEFEETGEVALVQARTTDTLTIKRGAFDTTAAAVTAGTTIRKNPRFSQAEIDDAIDTTIRSLWPQIYTFGKGTFTYSATSYWYPLSDENIEQVLNVYYEDVERLNPVSVIGWRDYGELDGTEFTQTKGLYLFGTSGLEAGDDVYYTYQKQITDAADLLDRQEGMVATGVVYHLMGGDGVGRTQDPGRRTDRTVQPGQELRDSYWYFTEFDRLKRLEEISLAKTMDELLPKSRTQRRVQNWRA